MQTLSDMEASWLGLHVILIHPIERRPHYISNACVNNELSHKQPLKYAPSADWQCERGRRSRVIPIVDEWLQLSARRFLILVRHAVPSTHRCCDRLAKIP